MKFFLILISCTSVLGSPFQDDVVPDSYLFKELENKISKLENNLQNPIDKLWEAALEYIRKLLETYEPFEVPDMPEQTVTGDGFNLKAKFNHVKVSKASDFVIDHLENHIIGLYAIFNVTLPQMHIEGDYTVSGTINGRNVKSTSDGHFTLDIDHLKTGGYVKMSFKGTYLEMKQLDIDYEIRGLKFDESGLVVDGMTEEEIKQLFSDSEFLKYFQDNEKFVCSQVSNYVRETANKILYNKSLQGLLEWLKEVIDGKVIPTPPPNHQIL